MTDSESEEEILVVVEFADPVPSCTDSNKIKMIGLDSDTPIVQYEKQVFKGEWKDCLGTKMLFVEKETPDAWDPAFSPQVSKQYECAYLTQKVLKLKSVVLTPREEKDGGPVEEDDDEESEEEASDGDEPDGKIIIKTEAVGEDDPQPGTSSSL